MSDIEKLRIFNLSKKFYNHFEKSYKEQRIDPTDQAALKQFQENQVALLYPHTFDMISNINRQYTCKEVCCCHLSPGYFCCCTSKPPQKDFQNFGLGINLYFKFLFHACCFFLLISLLSLFSCAVCYRISIQNGFTPTDDYQTFLFSTTYGVFSAERYKCEYGLINKTTNSVDATLECPYGRIKAIGSVLTNQSLDSLFNCKSQRKKFESTPNFGYAVTNIQAVPLSIFICSGLQSCTITQNLQDQVSYQLIAYSYQCQNNKYVVGSIELDSRFYLYILVIIDLITCIGVILFLFSQGKAEQVQKKYFQDAKVELRDYSVRVKGFSENKIYQEFERVTNGVKERNRDTQLPLSLKNIKVPDKLSYIEYQNQRTQIYLKISDLIAKQFYEKNLNVNEYENNTQFEDKCFENVSQFEDYKNELKDLYEKYQKQQYLNQSSNEDDHSIYVTLNTIKNKHDFMDSFERRCCRKALKIREKDYKVEEPLNPDLIIWKNLNKNTKTRTCISWFITFVIILGSYLLFGFVQFRQNEILQNYNYDIDCDVLFPQGEFRNFDQTQFNSNENFKTCYCKQRTFDLGEQYCSEWRKNYGLYIAIPFIISMGIILYNLIVAQIFRWITYFQFHKTSLNQFYSYTMKRAVIFVMNMGIVMMLLNINYNNQTVPSEFSFIFLGRYNDITSDWYFIIGSIIVLTMIFNILFPVLQVFSQLLFKCLKKCWDKRCCCRITSKKTKLEYISLFADDIYPLEQRYAYLIAVLFICLLFSGLIPLLNFITGISILLLYLMDKLLLFKLFQTPKNYGQQLQPMIHKTIYFGLIVHMAATAILLSQEHIIAQDSTIQGDTYNQSRLFRIVNTTYIIPYVALFFLLIVVVIFEKICLQFLKKCSQCCKDRQKPYMSEYMAELPFFKSINHQQRDHLIHDMSHQLNQFDNQEKHVQKIGINQIRGGKSPNQSTDRMNQSIVENEKRAVQNGLYYSTIQKSLNELKENPNTTVITEQKLIGPSSFSHLVHERQFKLQQRRQQFTDLVNLEFQMSKQATFTKKEMEQ